MPVYVTITFIGSVLNLFLPVSSEVFPLVPVKYKAPTAPVSLLVACWSKHRPVYTWADADRQRGQRCCPWGVLHKPVPWPWLSEECSAPEAETRMCPTAQTAPCSTVYHHWPDQGKRKKQVYVKAQRECYHSTKGMLTLGKGRIACIIRISITKKYSNILEG